MAMPVYNVWEDDQHTIIRRRFTGDWTWEEVHAAADQARVMFDTVNYQVDTILDFEDSSMMAAGFPRQIQLVGESPEMTHANAGLVVVAGGSSLHEAFGKAVGTLYRPVREKSRFVKTVEEARALLAKERTSG
jgi:hypothetical protein